MSISFSEAPTVVEAFPSEIDLEPNIQARFEAFLRLPEVAEALTLLDQLPDNLVYHRKEHTIDVIHDTMLFALADKVPENILQQQIIAAAWHDVGYIREVRAQESEMDGLGTTESRAIDMFSKSIANKRMSEEDALEVRANIWDTRVIQEGGNGRFSMDESRYGYMLDGDLSNVGRDDFKINLEKYGTELKLNLSDPVVRKKYYTDTLILFQNHDWKTKSARFYREKKKRENLAWLQKEIESIVSN